MEKIDMTKQVIRMKIRTDTEDVVPELLDIKRSHMSIAQRQSSMALLRKSRANSTLRTSTMNFRKTSLRNSQKISSRTFDEVISNKQISIGPSTSSIPRKPRANTVTGKKSIMKTSVRTSDENIANIPIPTRVFLYIQLRKIVRLPSYDHMLLQLDCDAPLTKLQDHYTTDNFIDLKQHEIATFSITLTQDSFDNLNSLCDSPIGVTLYRVTKRRLPKSSEFSSDTIIQHLNEIIEKSDAHDGYDGEGEGEEEDDFEYEDILVPVAQGYIDVLNFFCKKRTFSEMITYLYPLHHDEIQVDIGTTLATFHLYTLVPLLKNLSFANLCYISFESIYNYAQELAIDCANLVAKLSFRSKIKGTEQIKINLCSYTLFTECVINDQNPNLNWENLKSREKNNNDTLSIQSGIKVRVHTIFKDLLCTEGVDFRFDEIDTFFDPVLLCNSLHRFVLSKEITRTLENTVLFNEHEFIVEIHKEGEEEILLQGVIDLSVFGYPNVHTCRFAVELQPPNVATSAKTVAKDTISLKSAKQRSKSLLSASGTNTPTAKNLPTFCVISICMIAPITEDVIDVHSMNENFLQTEKLKCCLPTPYEHLRPQEATCEEAYREFDVLVETFIQYIVKNNLIDLTNNSLLCCNLDNLVSKLMKIMACDFSVRFPTKTNLEFTNLMTTVYKELEQRMYELVQTCDEKNIYTCCIPDPSAENKMITQMMIIKYLHECGDLKMSEFLYEKLKAQFPTNVSLWFYTYLWDVEIKRFDSAREYSKRPLKEKVPKIGYFVELINIYMDYMDELVDDEKCETALERVLRNLEKFNHHHSYVIDGWILLYCFYVNCKYQPGITYARWKYENLYNSQRKQLVDIPKSRWEIYNNCELNFRSIKAKFFQQTLKLFLCLGLYKFAEVVYSDIAKENIEIERYLMNTTFKILLEEVDPKYAVKMFPTEKMTKGDHYKALNLQVSGSLEYYRGSFASAIRTYSRLLDIHTIEDMHEFKLGLLRCGYLAMDDNNYELAVKIFEKCSKNLVGKKLVSLFQLGKSLYKLDRLPEALTQFVECTKLQIHLPDIWGYLALINLRLGNNFNALECWKYAKLDPENVISDEILEELDKIPHSEIFLYVDFPMAL